MRSRKRGVKKKSQLHKKKIFISLFFLSAIIFSLSFFILIFYKMHNWYRNNLSQVNSKQTQTIVHFKFYETLPKNKKIFESPSQFIVEHLSPSMESTVKMMSEKELERDLSYHLKQSQEKK